MRLAKPIFIIGCHKSGTSLLRSLLDGHPDLDFVFPNELHFFVLSGYQTRYPLGRRFDPPSDFRAFTANALLLIEQTLKGKNPYSPFHTDARFHRGRFLARMDDHNADESERGRLLRYFDAVAGAFGCDLDRRDRPVRIVEKSVTNLEFAIQLKRLFPDCRIVHVIRNPYANLVAIRRSRFRGGQMGKLEPFIRAIEVSLRQALTNDAAIPDYHVVRYEDVVGAREETIGTLCSRLRLRHLATMRKPTVLGQSWDGNSTSGVKFEAGISDRPLQEWKSQITGIETELVNRHLSDIMQTVGYAPVSGQRHWLVPERTERPVAYLANRRFGRRARAGVSSDPSRPGRSGGGS